MSQIDAPSINQFLDFAQPPNLILEPLSRYFDFSSTKESVKIFHSFMKQEFSTFIVDEKDLHTNLITGQVYGFRSLTYSN